MVLPLVTHTKSDKSSFVKNENTELKSSNTEGKIQKLPDAALLQFRVIQVKSGSGSALLSLYNTGLHNETENA